MSGLKSAWELSLERSDKLVPELKTQKKLTKKQKQEIADIRTDFSAKIADLDVTTQSKMAKLSDRVPPEEIHAVKEELDEYFRSQKKTLEEQMEQEVETVRSRKG
jgi:exonuclease VII large subunit